MRRTCGHDRPSWHYLGVPFTIRGWIWTTIGTNVGTIVEVGTISAYLSLSEGGCGPKLNKVGTIGCGCGPKLNKVGTIAAQIGPNLSKVGTIGTQIRPKLIKVDVIGGGFGPKLSKVATIEVQIGPSGHYRGLDTLSYSKNGRFLDTIDKFKGSSGPRAKWRREAP